VPSTIGANWFSGSFARLRQWIRTLIFGRPLATSLQLEHRLPIYLALPVFASDALSSVAYATQEILLQFEEHTGITPAALQMMLWVSLAIAVLVLIVGFSYYQAIHLYPSGGGSYSVSRDNLGVFPGLLAASALVIDYVLTVAVSVSSGVENLASTPVFNFLHHEVHLGGFSLPGTVPAAIVFIGLITILNLRGTKESGWSFAAPAYLFVTMLLLVISTTAYRMITGTLTPIQAAVPVAQTTSGIGLFLILKAFASGCSALTGVEAVSNGVSAFEPPEAKNAQRTLVVLIIILITLFLGVSGAAFLYQAAPSETNSVISQVAASAFGMSGIGYILYWLTIIATLLVLLIAANTSFAGFPRLLAIVAKDGYMPRTFTTLGDRLVHNRGIALLTIVSALLVIGYRAKTNSLIPLYAVGVFICFTLSQLGMVRKVLALREKGWMRLVVINGTGALITGVVAIVQAWTKFSEGAWMVVVLLPILIGFSYIIHRHYAWFDSIMTVNPNDFNPLSEPAGPVTVLVLVSSDVHRGILEGLECGRVLAQGNPQNVLRAVHIEMDPEKTPRLQRKWEQLVEPYLSDVKLDIVPSPYRWLIEPILDYIDWTDLERTGDRVIVVLPEFETGNVFTRFLHNFTALRLRTALLNRPHVTVVSSRYFMRPMAWRAGRGGLVF
jgi:amino acid transporter